jgi:hypothetical protein
MLLGETVAVYCENHTEHTDAVRNAGCSKKSFTMVSQMLLCGECYENYSLFNTLHEG